MTVFKFKSREITDVQKTSRVWRITKERAILKRKDPMFCYQSL